MYQHNTNIEEKRLKLTSVYLINCIDICVLQNYGTCNLWFHYGSPEAIQL